MTKTSINTNQNIIQEVYTSLSSVVTCTGTFTADDSIPQNTGGTEVLTLAITPKYSTSILEIKFNSVITKDANNGSMIVALFQDTTAAAISAGSWNAATASRSIDGNLIYYMTSGTTSSTTFKIRVGPTANSCYVNADTTGNRLMGGVSSTILKITEYI